MADFGVKTTRTADATLAVGGILADASAARRIRLYDLIVGSKGTPADNPFEWVLERGTTGLGTSTPVTPSPLDPADIASVTDAGENYTVNPTLGVNLMAIALNQRATFRWVAAPGKEFVMAAAANGSLILRTPTSAAVSVTGEMYFTE